MRRIERLINLIAALLDTRRPLSADEIRDRIQGYDQETHEAFRRAFERDKEALRALGIPVEAVSIDPLHDASADGYIIPKDRYYLPPLELEADEAAALRIAAGAVLGSADAARAGLLKLQIDAPSAPAEGPRVVWGADVAAEQPHLGPLYEAVVGRTPVRFTYRRGGAAGAEARELEPYGLIHRRGHWYVIGRDVERDGLRAFKLSRIEGGVRRLRGAYELPEGFDPGAHLPREAWELGTEGDVAVVRFDADLRWWAEQNLAEARMTEGPDGALDVSLPVANVDALISWVLGFGDRVQIVAPAEARARIRDQVAIHGA